MLHIPFIKAHGAKNDFLLTWSHDLPSTIDFRAAARAICDRNAGIGADGWLLVSKSELEEDGAIRLYNADGSDSEISGNGTRCAAALLVDSGVATRRHVSILTGAGVKHLEIQGRDGNRFTFEMNMGNARVEHLYHDLGIALGPVTILNVGNPQCVAFVPEGQPFPEDWAATGAYLEGHPFFPKRTNVSFVRPTGADDTLEVRFYERGVGVTHSSGTGSTGAAAAAVARGLVKSPVRVETAAGPLSLCWKADDIYLTGPAEITAKGEFLYRV